MQIKEIKSGSQQMWDPQERSNQYLKKKMPLGIESAPYFASSLTSLNPIQNSIQTNKMEPVAPKQVSGVTSWMSDKYRALMKLFGINQQRTQVEAVQKTDSTERLKKTAGSDQKQQNLSPTGNTEEVQKGFFEKTWDWIKEKWNSFLEFIGVRSSYKPQERDRTNRVKILERKSPNEIDEEGDFKYLDFTNTDPLKAMIAILVQQGILRQEQAFLITQKILLGQEDLKDAQAERIQLQAELAVIDKRSGILEKIKIGTTAAQILGFIASAVGVIAGAATVATGGTLSGSLAVVTLVFNGLVGGAQAGNTWLKGNTKQQMEQLQAKYIRKSADRDTIQFQLKVDLKDIKKIFSMLTAHAEIGKALIDGQMVRK